MQRVTATDFENEVLDAPVPVLVDFYSDHCGPCRTLAPHLEQMNAEFNGAVKIVKANVDEQPELATYFAVQAVPTLILFEEGRIINRILGAHPASIRRLLASRCVA